MKKGPNARAAMKKEWAGQREQGVYDFAKVRDEVVREAKSKGKEVHGYMVYVLRRTTNCPNLIPLGSSKVAVYSSAIR